MPSYMNVEENRVDWFGSLYVDTAVENYYLAKCEYEQMSARQFEHYDDIQDGYETVIKYAFTTVVFSAMAMEALINDYAASCLGDETFYGSFDKLSVVDKFSLIVHFIFHKTLDKGQAYYSGLKTLFSLRNTLVHPKTKTATEEQQDEQLMFFEYDDNNPELGKVAFTESYRKEAHLRLISARDAIKTLYLVTQFIDANDPVALATLRLLIPQIISGDERLIMKAKQSVYPELGIKLQVITLR